MVCPNCGNIDTIRGGSFIYIDNLKIPIKLKVLFVSFDIVMTYVIEYCMKCGHLKATVKGA